MRRADLFSGIALRSALMVLGVFAVVIVIAGLAILSTTRAAMDSQIRSAISEDFDLLRDANVTGGEGELIGFVRNALATRSDRQFAIGLFKPDGRALAGNIADAPRFSGWGVLDHGVGQSDGGRFLAYVERLDDTIVVAAHSLRATDAIGQAILTALVIAGIVLGVAALGIGYAMNRAVSVKLDVIDTTLAAVSHGNEGARIPVGRSGDQIDHVSTQINAHLDRLSDNVTAMRNTIVAIAHDLKSPFNRAYLILQEATAATETTADADRLDLATRELETLQGIVDTVLRISRIGASDDRSHFAPFALADLLADLAQTFEPIIQGGNQTLVMDGIAPGGAVVRGDRAMLTQLAVNLIENAHRYAGPGTTIRIGLETAADGGVTMVVSDTGPGIPESLHEAVFEPFRRIEPERNLPGAGLGLALVKAIVVRHQARIVLADNRPGLRVSVTFPAALD